MHLISPEEELERHMDINRVLNRIFYKYVSIDDAKLILENKTLMFSNPSKFNDPLDCYEGIIKFDYTKMELKKLAEQHVKPALKPLRRKEKRAYLKKFVNHPTHFVDQQMGILLEMKMKLGVCCFSEVYDNILMWSHYAKNHTGVCIGFDLPVIQQDLYGLYPVMYKDKITRITRTMDYNDAMLMWVLSKASDWSYEREIRAVSMEYNGLVEIPPSTIKEIYFGCKIEPKRKIEITNLLRDNLKDVRKYQMKIDNKTFRLVTKVSSY
ncbi:MAG: DUF2971 domain-containing protein [Adhaeribacter sp.]